MYWVTSTSFKAIKKHLDTFFAANGRPSIIKSDNGPPFQSYEFAEYLKRQNIQHSRILPENPQANEVENFMRHLHKALQIAKLLHEDYKTYVRRMLMVLVRLLQGLPESVRFTQCTVATWIQVYWTPITFPKTNHQDYLGKRQKLSVII